MKIAVCIKHVPDTTVDKVIDPSSLRLDRAVAAVPNPFDEYAVEEALRLVENLGGTVVGVCVGPEKAADSLRRVLAMGIERACLVTDTAIGGSDTLGTARVLAAVLKREQFDLILCGQESTDARTGVVPARLAEELGLPQITYARKIEVEGDRLRVERQTDEGAVLVEATLPALVTVVKGINEPRYPSLKGIMAAKKKEISRFDLASLGLSPELVGEAGARVKVLSLAFPEARQGGRIVKADGNGGRIIADYLEQAAAL